MPQERDLPEQSDQLRDHGIYVFMDDVDSESVKPIVEWLLTENHAVKKKKKELLLMICSSGGELESAFALIDVIRSSSIPIKTVGLGQIASAGLMIFLAGKTRVLTPNTSILSHQYTWGSEGKHHELWAVTKEFNLVHERMLTHYRMATGLSDSVIKEKLLPPQDVYLSAEEAVQLKICHYISDLTQR
jgi:ATP-dependent Clp protease protease subunit